ncbi:MAG: DUF421 domain-containing protein [Bacilli bacterium]|nr:DUF421 domain-containing protein [Bacilli bacterium]
MIEKIIEVNWIEVLDVVLRSLLSLVSLFLVTKMLGKKQVSQLSLFDYVIGISIGNFAAETTINLESQYINGIVAVLMFGLVAYLVSIITMKSIILRRYFMGVPTLIIQQGKLLKKNMKKVKIDINDLLEECRSSGYFDLNEIEYAIMEPNGKISILPKWEYKNVTPEMLKIKGEKSSLCANIIIDGKVMTNNLKNMKKDNNWLEKQAFSQGYKDYKNILLATLDLNNQLTIYEKNEEIEILEILE